MLVDAGGEEPAVVEMMKGKNTYPANWKEIATSVKADAGWACVRCGVQHRPKPPYVLTVHHLDMDKANCRWWNIIPLCQRCHLSIQGRVNLCRPWVWEHSEWFRPYVAGYYAWRYLGQEVTREEVLSRLDELLSLEADTVLEQTEGRAVAALGDYVVVTVK